MLQKFIKSVKYLTSNPLYFLTQSRKSNGIKILSPVRTGTPTPNETLLTASTSCPLVIHRNPGDITSQKDCRMLKRSIRVSVTRSDKCCNRSSSRDWGTRRHHISSPDPLSSCVPTHSGTSRFNDRSALLPVWGHVVSPGATRAAWVLQFKIMWCEH